MNLESDFHKLGGQEGLSAIIEEFVDRVFGDMMIGFYFRNISRERILKHEYDHAAEFLGAPVAYKGRSLEQAHRPHQIFSGHFNRRKKLLDDVLKKHLVPDEVRSRWIEYTESLRGHIVVRPC